MNIHIASLSKWEEPAVLLFVSVLMMLFVFGPIFLLVLKQLSKFKNNDIKEHESGQSQISYYLFLTLFLSFAMIAWDVAIWTLEHVFPNWGNISGNGGKIEKFWTVQHIEVDELSTYKETMANRLTDTVIVLRNFTETLCFVVIFIMLYLSVKTTNLILSSYRDKTEPSGLIGASLKIMMVGIVSYITISFYSETTVSMLNHPNDLSVWDISTLWIKTGIENFGLTLDDGKLPK